MNLTLPASVIRLGHAWWKALLGAAIVFWPAFFLGQCSGADRERDRSAAAIAVARAAAEAANSAALEKSSAQRASDAEQVGRLTEDLTNAVAQAPDSLPAPAAIALGCQRLRASGRDVSDLPQCR